MTRDARTTYSWTDRITLDERTGWWLIGSVMATPSLMAAAAELDAEDLSQFDQQTWWRCMQRVHANGDETNVPVVAEALESEGLLAELGGPGQVIYLADQAPYISHTHVWIEQIRRSAVRRRLDAEAIRIRQMVVDPTILNEEIAERLESAAEILAHSRRDDDTSISARELDENQFQIDYLIPGILARRQFCMGGGPSKGLKTTILAADLGLSLATGDKFLNEFYTTCAVRVGVISCESGGGTLQETFRRIARTKQIRNLRDYDNLRIDFALPKLSEPGTIRRLIRWVNKHQLEVVIFDPLYLMAGLSDNAANLFVVGSLLAMLQTVGDETGATLVVLHHYRNLSLMEEHAAPELKMLAWSGFEQYARQWLLLNRREKYDPETGHHKLWLAAGGSAGHGGLFAIDAREGRQSDLGGRCWDVTVARASEARQAARRARDEQREQVQQETHSREAGKILDTLRKNPDGLTRSVLRDLTCLNLPKVNLAVTSLIEKKLVESCRIPGNNGQKYPGFKASIRTPVQPSVQRVRMPCTDGRASASYFAWI